MVLLKVLDFCNLIDDNKRLSITNITLLGLTLKLVLSPNADWPSIVSIMVAYGNYAHKRAVNSAISEKSE